MSAKKDSLIELKGAMLPVLSVILRSLDPARLREEARRMFGEEAFFDGDLAALDFSAMDTDAADISFPDWTEVIGLFAGHGLRVIGIRGGSPALAASAGAAGLPPLAIAEPPSRSQPARPAPAGETKPAAPAEAKPAAGAEAKAPPMPAPAAPPLPAASSTVIVDRPLRSGQRVYARGGDVVVLAVVNPGAEVIADGSIHVYAPLRGRALAGASGNTQARILTTRLEAELVSVAGLYRTFEDGVPAQLASKPAQIRLVDEGKGGNPRLVVEALAIG